jgi:hypothetical protein
VNIKKKKKVIDCIWYFLHSAFDEWIIYHLRKDFNFTFLRSLIFALSCVTLAMYWNIESLKTTIRINNIQNDDIFITDHKTKSIS